MRKVVTRNKVLLAIGLVLVVGIVVYVTRGQTAKTTQYFTTSIENGPLRNVVNATGTIQTVVTVQVGSQVSGQLEELYADFNSVVKRGQLLAKIDPRNFQAQVENAEASVAAARARVRSAEADQRTQVANLQSAKANLEAARVTRDNTATLFQRASELNKSGVASRNDYDNSKANADSAVAKYEQAQASIAQVEGSRRSKPRLTRRPRSSSKSALNCNRPKPTWHEPS
jgi:HlyD family secretion protein